MHNSLQAITLFIVSGDVSGMSERILEIHEKCQESQKKLGTIDRKSRKSIWKVRKSL